MKLSDLSSEYQKKLLQLVDQEWVPISGWGKTPREFLDLSLSPAPGEVAPPFGCPPNTRPEDIVYTSDTGSEMTRMMAYDWWDRSRSFYAGFIQGWLFGLTPEEAKRELDLEIR